MKNDVMALPGSSPRAIDSTPFTCFVALNSGWRLWTSACCFCGQRTPRAQGAGLHDEPGTTRWNDVPSKTPACASRRKLRTCSGALSGKNATVMAPIGRLDQARYCASCSTVSVANACGSGGSVSRIDDALDLDTLPRQALVVRGRLGNLTNDFQAFAHAPENGVLTGQRRLIGDADEELRAAAVGIAGTYRGRDRSARERLVARLGLEHAETAGAVLLALCGILRERIAALMMPSSHAR